MIINKFIYLNIFLTTLFIYSNASGNNSSHNNYELAETFDWLHSSGNNHSLRNANINQINKNNIHNLKEAFNYKFKIQYNGSAQSNPIKINNSLYFVDGNNKLFSINSISGKKNWITHFNSNISRRGLTGNDKYIYVTSSDGVYEINNLNGEINFLYKGSFSIVAPIISDNYLYFISNNGILYKYDLYNKILIWEKKISNNCGTARVWSGFSYSEKDNILLISTGNSNSFWYDDPSNCLANSIVGISSISGEIKWIFQELKNDYWDLDMVANPIILENDNSTNVVAFSKTGNIFIVDINNGKLLNKSEKFSNNNHHKNSNMAIGGLKFKLSDIKKTDSNNKDYIHSKLRNFEDFNYEPAKPGKNIFLYGLHGGFQWQGGSINDKNFLFVASNNFPWIIRSEHEIKFSVDISKDTEKSKYLSYYCSDCHKKNLSRTLTTELDKEHAGLYIPSLLTDVSLNSFAWIDINYFHQIHKFAVLESKLLNTNIRLYENNMTIFWKTIRFIDRKLEIKYLTDLLVNFHSYFNWFDENSLYKKLNSLNDELLRKIRNEYLKLIYDNSHNMKIIRANFWQPLNDIDGFPINEHPFGYLNAFDLKSKKLIWSVPLGYELDKNNSKVYGSRNFAGILTTTSGLVFVTGTPDKKLWIFDSQSGKILHTIALPSSGSASPITYVSGGCQYIAVISTGGKYTFYNKNTFSSKIGSINAFKLSTCN